MPCSFEDLVASRREWIDNVLRPWCREAALKDLLRAELEWGDIAGRVDPQSTLWTWAWGRFPALVHEGLSGVNESREVRVRLRDGTTAAGFPDNRRSQRGKLFLVGRSAAGALEDHGPYSIDEIAAVEPVP